MVSPEFGIGREHPTADRPNALYVFTDHRAADAMSCAGSTDLSTPTTAERLATQEAFRPV